MSLQTTMNIGTIGHVALGKTTLVRAIQTTKHKIEKESNITYYLGYAIAKLYGCQIPRFRLL